MEILEMTKGKSYANLKFQYEAVDTLTAAGTSNIAIRLPGGDISAIAYDLQGTGTIQVCGTPVSSIEADTAIWRDVESGDSINLAATAMRQINVNGDTTILHVRAV